MKTLRLAFPLLLVLASAHAGYPWKGEGKEGKYKGRSDEEYLQELNLTPEQMEQFAKQREESNSAKEGLRNSIREKHRELREELDSETTDNEKLESIVSELKSLEAQRIDQKVKSIIQMKEILTPEQFQKVHEIVNATSPNRFNLGQPVKLDSQLKVE